MGSELTDLGVTNLGRACRLWLNLAGVGWDFDDLQQELAVRLGWVDRGGLDLGEFLDQTAAIIDAASWRQVRSVAVEVFFDVAGDRCCECGELDPRSFEELCDDTQFDASGSCRLCELDPGGDPELHRAIASALVTGRVGWEQVLAAAG